MIGIDCESRAMETSLYKDWGSESSKITTGVSCEEQEVSVQWTTPTFESVVNAMIGNPSLPIAMATSYIPG